MLIEMLQRKYSVSFLSSFLIHEIIAVILRRKQIVANQAHFDVLLLFIVWSVNINIVRTDSTQK